MTRKNIGREQIVETATRLIDENNGTRNVTLREIAKELNCAHTNLYNYFGSLDEIYWAVLAEIIDRMLSYMNQPSDTAKTPEDNLFLKLSRFIDFYIDHPGWYRLAWLEPLNGNAPPDVEQAIGRPMQEFAQVLTLACPKPLTLRETQEICNILFMYTFGELGVWINHRTFETNLTVMKENIAGNTKRLYHLLIK
ncbi:TetR/AcrR family transcriptional regulator [Acetanaerobacterium elongatum]|uniref:Transcriptional regulator, TetR family n=1 Tax=Acetanaerobacterium elongatum TaxID=258515 RepID=A0A1H0EWI3_9FIRM|nr:TetR/AcrR family transcriptional regulator [Acetanaerobacterium elongatum]SDN86703.1 transcriptional regulator, TetR family [Acetanaerobacterium elongatum]